MLYLYRSCPSRQHYLHIISTVFIEMVCPLPSRRASNAPVQYLTANLSTAEIKTYSSYLSKEFHSPYGQPSIPRLLVLYSPNHSVTPDLKNSDTMSLGAYIARHSVGSLIEKNGTSDCELFNESESQYSLTPLDQVKVDKIIRGRGKCYRETYRNCMRTYCSDRRHNNVGPVIGAFRKDGE